MDPTYPQLAALLLCGLFIGTISSMLGIGGGILVIPILTGLFAFSQKRAVGTSLAMLLPPIGLFAVREAYKAGNVQIATAVMLATGFLLGGLLGGKVANATWMPDALLRKVFAWFLFYVGCQILFKSDPRMWAVVKTFLVMAGLGLAYVVSRSAASRWEKTSAAGVYAEQLAALKQVKPAPPLPKLSPGGED